MMTKQPSGLAHLLLVGVVFHAIYVLSIFDIYFTSPVVPHIESLVYTDSPPAKRVVIFVADGCRADKFFEANASSEDSSSTTTNNSTLPPPRSRVPFLRQIIKTQGSWGVSHTRVPTESRPGHVALFAGMYEDVSAVTKGWSDNPVDFDSIFNQSRQAFLFGSPDIVPLFARDVPHAVEEHYSPDAEDFAHHDASILDRWVLDHVQHLFLQSQTNLTLHRALHEDRVVFFCHFLGIDSNGHAFRPHSDQYLNNIALVDDLVATLYDYIETYYEKDGRTAYVFTADHGMGAKGAHGDGEPANTRTPLVVWGAGVEGPQEATRSDTFELDLPTQSRAQVQAQLQAQEEQEAAAQRDWLDLQKFVRKDVMQADVAPLISALLGSPYPRNSVGVLPFSYLRKGAYRAQAVRSNARQLYLHAVRKEQQKRAHTLLWFVPYARFQEDVPPLVEQLSDLYDQNLDDWEQLERTSQKLIAICLATLEYLQRYDWFFLLSLIVLGYLGWILVVTLAYVHPYKFQLTWLLGPRGDHVDLKLLIGLFTAFVYLSLEHSPISYFLYALFPLVFWICRWNHMDLLRSCGDTRTLRAHWKHVALIFVCLELVVLGYERRAIFGLLSTILAMWPYLVRTKGDEKCTMRWFGLLPHQVWTTSCLGIAVFPYLPSEHGEHTLLVHVGGILTLLLNGIVRHQLGLKWRSASFLCQRLSIALLVALYCTMTYLDGERRKPPILLTLANWLLADLPVVQLLVRVQKLKDERQEVEETSLKQHLDVQENVRRLVDVMLAFAPSYILVSIAYDVLFYVVLCAVLLSWLLFEALSALETASSSMWHEVQRAFLFLLLIQKIQIAFFWYGQRRKYKQL